MKEDPELLLLNIRSIMMHVSMINFEELEKKRDELRSDLARYEALGITDGHAYLKKHGTKKALLQRMEALCKLVGSVQRTKDVIDLEAIKPEE